MKTLAIDCRMINMSGIGTYLKNIIPGLIDSKQFKIYCLGYENLKNFSWFNTITYVPLTSAILSVKEQFELVWKMPKCDLFWSPNWNIPLLFIKAKKRIVTIHDVYHLANSKSFSKLKIAGIRFYMKIIKNFYRHIITVSEFSKNEIVEYTRIPSKRITVIPLSVADDFLEFQIESPTTDPYILYVGNVKPHKNLLLTLEAFKEINDKKIKLFIVGKKDGFITNDNSLESNIEELEGRVCFTGEISDNRLKTYYNFASLFLFPSRYEGFGLPVLEAMKFGLPIICSSSASLPEVAGDSVIYFDAYNVNDLVNKIDGFLSGEIKTDIDRYPERLQKFSWRTTITKHIEVFNQAVA